MEAEHGRQISGEASEEQRARCGSLRVREIAARRLDATASKVAAPPPHGVIANPNASAMRGLAQADSVSNTVAGLMITTEAMVAEHPKKEAPAMPGGGMGGMGGMDY